MKKLLSAFISFFFFISFSFGQGSKNHIKGNNLGVSFFLNDFKTASDIRTNGLVKTLKDHSLFDPSIMSAGAAINYLGGLSNHVDFIATLGASFVNYPNSNIPNSGNDHLLLETTASVNLKSEYARKSAGNPASKCNSLCNPTPGRGFVAGHCRSG